jgi:chemosensory pili system protein ChpA (sensor histidine kinase/response regulator)
MGSFSIDDVRETFGPDIGLQIANLESALSELASLPALREAPPTDSLALFQRIADAGHTIAGTSGLVSADSIHESALLLESLAEGARAAMSGVVAALEQARRAMDVCRDGAKQMRAMVTLELDHQGEAARRLAQQLSARAAEQPASDPSALEFTFDPDPDPDPELAAVFREEASRVFVELEANLVVLRATRTKESAARCRRSFHTLKGAAATVGLDGTSAIAAQAEDSLDAVVDSGQEVTPELVQLVDSFASMLLKATGIASPSTMSSVEHAELQAVFRQEAEAALTELSAALETLTRAQSRAALMRVARAVHTLKGAAAAVGLMTFAELAKKLYDQLEEAVDTGLAPDDAQVRWIVESSNPLLRGVGLPEIPTAPSILGAAGAPSMATGSAVQAEAEEFSFDDPPGSAARLVNRDAEPGDLRHSPAIAAELAEIFQQEARESLIALQGHFEALRVRPADLAALGHIERIFHTLKGAAATVGLREISQLALGLQRRVEELIEGAIPVDASLLDELQQHTKALLRAAGISDVVSTRPRAPSAEDVATAEAAFDAEARQICAQALSLGAQLGHDGGAHDGDVRAELGRLFHRLKGSALVSTRASVATDAAELQRQAARGTLTLEALRTTVGHIRTAIGDVDAAPSALSGGPASASSLATREPVLIRAEPEVWEAFCTECSDLLEELDKAVLALEESPQPKRALELVLRLIHTLKGAVNTVGLGPVGAELHRIEDFLETLAESPILPPIRQIASFLLRAQADVRRNLRLAPQGYVETSLSALEERIVSVLHGTAPKAQREPQSRDAQSQRSNPADSHQSQGSARSDQGLDAREKRVIRVATARLDALMNLAGELVVSRSRLGDRVGKLRALQTELGSSRRRLIETVERFREEHEFSVGQRPLRSEPAAAPTTEPAPWSAFGELELDRYDDVNVLSRSLTEITDDLNETNTLLFRELSTFADDSEAFGRLVSGIQGEVTRARMVALEVVFSRLRLPVRDAAERDGKDVRVETVGELVSMDKTIADALFAPMLHLVRNAVGHGIEPAARRQKAGKEPTGTVTLTAREEAGQISLEVRDDGAGLDLEALRARGVKMGLVAESTPLTDPSIRDLVFAPGLSTRAKAGDVSGRGVGCDVVRRAIERLNGTIRVETRAGKGTSFHITLPITLAITKALVVRDKGVAYAIPLHFADRILGVDEATIVESAGHNRIKLDGGIFIVRSLDALLAGEEGADAESGPLSRGPVIALRIGDRRVFVQVDAVVGQEEIVVKSLGELLSGHESFAGVTIRGSGELVLIVDVRALVSPVAQGADLSASPEPSPEGVGLQRSKEELARVAAPAATERAQNDERERVLQRTPVLAAVPRGAQVRNRIRVLFADDSLSVRKVAERTLQALGVEVTLAVDGVEAMSKLREGSFDILFTDLEMPRMHGYDLIRELRFVPSYKDLPVVVVSSRSAQKHQDQARALGATDYITKPFTQQALDAALTKWCKR